MSTRGIRQTGRERITGTTKGQLENPASKTGTFRYDRKFPTFKFSFKTGSVIRVVALSLLS